MKLKDLKEVQDMMEVIDILSEAVLDCQAIAGANPLDRSSVSLRALCFKAITHAKDIMKNYGETIEDEA